MFTGLRILLELVTVVASGKENLIGWQRARAKDMLLHVSL